MHSRIKYPFQAVAVRYVHDVLSGEFLNVGVVLICPERSFAGSEFVEQWSRVTAAFPNAELPHLRRVAARIKDACTELWPEKRHQTRLVEAIDIMSFIRDIMPLDDASIQFSAPIYGLTPDPHQTLLALAQRYAFKYFPDSPERAARQDADVWQEFATVLASVFSGKTSCNFQPLIIRSTRSHHYELEVERAWKNGKWNAAQPLSLDLLDPRAIREKAANWSGKVLTVRPSEQNINLLFLLGMPRENASSDVLEAAHDAAAILKENLEQEAAIYTEDQSRTLAEKIQKDLLHN